MRALRASPRVSQHSSRSRRYRELRERLLASATHCARCNRPISDELPVNHPQKATVDHIWPRVRGGTDDPSNLVAVCAKCNGRKGARVPTPPVRTKSRDW